MATAIELGTSVRGTTSPNPWVGAVVGHRRRHRPSTAPPQPPGGRHAEVVALAAAGDAGAAAATPSCTSPSSPAPTTAAPAPCADALVAAGVRRVVVGVADPDPQVAGGGHRPRCGDAGIDVEVGLPAAEAVADQLAPYLKHRRTGRPCVVLKLAATLDGRTAAADGTSPVDHRPRGPGRRPPAAGRERRHRRRRRHGRGPTTRRSPSA